MIIVAAVSRYLGVIPVCPRPSHLADLQVGLKVEVLRHIYVCHFLEYIIAAITAVCRLQYITTFARLGTPIRVAGPTRPAWSLQQAHIGGHRC